MADESIVPEWITISGSRYADALRKSRQNAMSEVLKKMSDLYPIEDGIVEDGVREFIKKMEEFINNNMRLEPK